MPPAIQDPIIIPIKHAIRIACMAFKMESIIPFSMVSHLFFRITTAINAAMMDAKISGICTSRLNILSDP